MASTKRDEAIAWLRDAHAMEVAHVENLDRLIRLSDDYPQLKSQLQKHLAISTKQRDEIDQELARFDTSRSILKDWAMRFTGQIEPLVSRFTRYIREEQEMASFLSEHLPEITRQYLRSRGA